MEREVPETQDRLAMSAPVPRRRKEKPVTKRSAVQVEQSMQGSNTIRSTPPSRTTQQSLIVEETPATNRKLAITEHVESNAGQEGSVDPKELVISTDVTTPTAVRDSFADNHKTMRAEQIVPSLELGSPDASTPSDLNEEEDATASEDENEEAQKAEDPDFSTAPEGKSATPKAASTAPESSSSPPQAMGEMELEDMTPSAAEQEMDRDKIADEEAEETPQAYPNSLLRQRPQPEVRITPSRSKKRSALEETPPHKPTKKSRRTKEQAQSQDPLASSIRVRAPSSAGPTPSTGKGEAVSQRLTPAKPQTPVASQSSRRSTSSAIEVKSPYKGKSPRVACSNTDMAERSGFPSFLRKAEVHIAEKVTEKGCDIVCIGISHGTYVKSAKLLLGLALGKQIVSEQWLLESRKAGKLLATSDFPPMRAPEEWRWGHTKEDVNEVLSLDRSKLFKGKVLFITPALKKEYGSGYSELERIAKAAGGKVMSKSAGEYKNRGDTVILALEKNDPDSITLMGRKDGSFLVQRRLSEDRSFNGHKGQLSGQEMYCIALVKLQYLLAR
ncbi:BRCT domain-containing protein [Macrophomina phaseolina MS6]|uniref:BRCT domain-containing protein n=1 Tax=Macrophomina phaseolina (strain MS6) TaxID=1126212 RepID=K2RCV8_MACPH|nr:BRCT domain-containing protein [Macrophomina phaseolina MS6]